MSFDGKRRPARPGSNPMGRIRPPQFLGTRTQAEHDVLVIPRKGAVQRFHSYRFPVHKDPGRPDSGQFSDPPEEWSVQDEGQRRLINVAEPPGTRDAEAARGPAIALLPVKPEPGAAFFGTCFLINVNNFVAPSLWTAEEWDDGPGGVDFETLEHPTTYEVLLAVSYGRVLRVRVDCLDRWRPGVVSKLDNGLGEVEAIELGSEMEVWSQLRNGVVAGTVAVRAGGPAKRVIPLVNLTALRPAGPAIPPVQAVAPVPPPSPATPEEKAP